MVNQPGQTKTYFDQNKGLCQPLNTVSLEPVYYKNSPDGSWSISIRPLCINTDIDIIYEWVNEEYAKRFWQMDGKPIHQLTR